MAMYPYKNPNKIPIGAKVNKEVWYKFKEKCKLLKVNAGDVLDDLMESWFGKKEKKNFRKF